MEIRQSELNNPAAWARLDQALSLTFEKGVSQGNAIAAAKYWGWNLAPLEDGTYSVEPSYQVELPYGKLQINAIAKFSGIELDAETGFLEYQDHSIAHVKGGRRPWRVIWRSLHPSKPEYRIRSRAFKHIDSAIEFCKG